METSDQTYRIYKELAERESDRGAEQLRDRFLVLAADAALTAGLAEEAEHLSDLLVQVNPTHMLKPFTSFGEAMKSAEVANYVADLRRTYPPEEASRLLQSLHGPAAAEEKPKHEEKLEKVEKSRPEPDASVPLPFKQPEPLPELAPPMIPPPYRPEPAPSLPEEEEAPPSLVSYYVATGLWVIVLAAALALAGHVFVRPFIM